MRCDAALKTPLQAFLRESRGKDIVCYGAGSLFQVMCHDLLARCDCLRFTGVIDRDPDKAGRCVRAGGRSVFVYTPQAAKEQLDFSQAVLLVTTARPDEIVQGLAADPFYRNIPVYSYAKIKREAAGSLPELGFVQARRRIPKVIHYCWFGGSELPPRLRRYMASWRAHCPDYEIRRWDERGYDVTKSAFTKRMYALKQWAFVSDYARMDVVYRHGGVYLDTDVELLGGLDRFLQHASFIGTEITGGINSGLGFGSVRGRVWMRQLLLLYERMAREDSPFLRTSNVGKETALLSRYGYRNNGRYQEVDGIAVYPYQVFSPLVEETGELLATKDTVSIHHFQGAWKQAGGT